MDAYQATKVVFSRIQALDPDHAAKIMCFLLIQDHGEKEMIRLAFGPEALLHAVMAKARNDLGLLPASEPPTPTSAAEHSPFMLCSSWAPPPVFSRSSNTNGAAEEMASSLGVEDLMSPAANGNGSPSPFFGGDSQLLDELHHLQDQLGVLNDGHQQQQRPLFDGGECRSPGAGGGFFPYGGRGHRRSSSVSEPCLYYARGYCKNGSACRFVHGGKVDAAALEQQCQDMLLRSKPQRLAAAFPYKCLSLLLQQNESQQRAAAAALMLGGDDKFIGRQRLRLDLASMMNPGSRQIYLTFPAGSTFREEDVSNYFSIYGPVHDVRIPYQQKRMFGFVTFVYPETVKLILAKGNPHFICDARVLVKPYREKGKMPDRKLKQQLPGERLDFSTNGLDSRDPLDLHQLGARMLQHSNSANEMLLRKKLEEQQAAELELAMELQSRRLMGLQLLDLKSRSPVPPSPIGVTFSPSRAVGSPTLESPPDSGEQGKGTSFHLSQRRPVNGVDKDGSSTGSDQSSAERNLPDSPFASPTAFAHHPFAPAELEISGASTLFSNASFVGTNNGGSLTNHLRPSALDIPSSPCPGCPHRDVKSSSMGVSNVTA